MNHRHSYHTGIIMVCLTVLALSGCGRTRPAKFYLLHPLQETAAKTQGANSLSIGIGPVDFPEYLDRPQIVTRVSPNEIQLADFDRWGEPLKENFTRVLAENLSMLLATDHIAIFPWKGEAPRIDYRVTVEVVRFDGTSENLVLLGTRWSVLDEKVREKLIEKKSTITVPAEGQGFEALVAAQSKAVAELSREIAAAIIGFSHR